MRSAWVAIRYSNDNYDDLPNESIRVYLDSQLIGQFTARDTGGWGAGWNVFKESKEFPVDLTPGNHRVTLAVAGGDGGGVEVDAIRIKPRT